MSTFESFARLPTAPMTMPSADRNHRLVAELKDWISTSEFPCVGAKAALSRQQITAVVLPDIGSASGDQRLHTALLAFVARARRRPTLFQTFAAIFETPNELDEAEFERCLWTRLQAVSDRDSDLGHPWDARVSADPSDPHFSLSFAGEAFFVVGLHPQASRPARRFGSPVLIFNMHAQFEQLRAEGKYEGLREAILQRDQRLAGSVNPMLQRFGENSEARQYSGRSVSGDWRCPFVAGGEAIDLGMGRETATSDTIEIAPRTGTAFYLSRGDRLTVIDPLGEQVADLLAFNRHDVEEVVSSGRTLDYASRIFLTKGDPLYSNRSNVMLRITEDTVGRHDFLLTPCSHDTFRIIYGDENPHRGCFGNLAAALAPFGITADRIPVAFNCFMNVRVDCETGGLRVDPPLSKAGDHITFVAEMDLVVGLTACSALQSNNGSFKPIHYSIQTCAD